MRSVPVLALACLSCAGQVTTEDPDPLGLQELMNIKVTSVQRKEQSLAHSAAAVTVITREDIKRAGFTTIQDALRLAPGLHVARIGTNVWGVGSRGFNGQFANKLQVLVDGRSVYLPMTSGVFWNSLDLFLDDVERIEVIRGPGAVMWGANAVTGVINIITRHARETVGTYVETGTGTDDRALTGVRHGEQVGDNLSFRVSGQYARREHLESGSEAVDESPWHSSRAAFRLDWTRPQGGALTLSATAYRSGIHDDYLAPSRTPGVNVLSHASSDARGGGFQGRWVQNAWRGQRSLQFNYSHFNQERTDYFGGKVAVFDFDFQQRVQLVRRHELLIGYGFRSSADETVGTWRAAFQPVNRRYDNHGWTLQHEFEIRPSQLYLSSGVRLEQNTLGGANAQPTVRLLWAPADNLSMWTAVSEARRAPSRVEQDLSLLISSPAGGLPIHGRKEPNPDFGSERLRAWEGGVRLQIAKKASIDTAIFRNGYSDLETWVPGDVYFSQSMGAVLPFLSHNLARGDAKGAEISTRYDLTYRLRLSGSATFYRSTLSAPVIHPLQEIRRDMFPGRQFQGHATWDVNRKLQWNSSFFFAGAMQRTPTPNVHRLDTSLRLRFNEWGGISAGVQNVLNARITEMRPEDGMPSHFMRRALRIRLQWWF